MFERSGRLVASTAQEGLIRKLDPTLDNARAQRP
jgi:acyl-CoA thioesterase